MLAYHCSQAPASVVHSQQQEKMPVDNTCESCTCRATLFSNTIAVTSTVLCVDKDKLMIDVDLTIIILLVIYGLCVSFAHASTSQYVQHVHVTGVIHKK